MCAPQASRLLLSRLPPWLPGPVRPRDGSSPRPTTSPLSGLGPHVPLREGAHAVVPSKGQPEGHQALARGASGAPRGVDPPSTGPQRPARRWCGRQPVPLTLVATQSAWNTAERPRSRTAGGDCVLGVGGLPGVFHFGDSPPTHTHTRRAAAQTPCRAELRRLTRCLRQVLLCLDMQSEVHTHIAPISGRHGVPQPSPPWTCMLRNRVWL